MKRTICELLAPAGNAECALAALDAGADAVYCGLGRFNARCRAENFDEEKLGALIDHMHRKGKKLYLTFNTLLFEEELESAAEMLALLVRLKPDALIVHDPGVIFMVRKFFPSLKLHGSTQMGIHNSAGVAVLAGMGVERVILERQLTFREIERIVKRSPIEIEVFIHGSLCCSLSGRCLLSAELCGGSGNRGCCKQPCRRAFETPRGRLFPLSMRDLNALEMIPRLMELGVSSLKIEGRLRGPDYVWKSVRAYRMVLDSPPGPVLPELFQEASALLRASSARNELPGFEPEKMTDPRRIGVFGRQAAAVEKVTRRGLLIKAETKVHLGDRFRLAPPDGGEGESFSLIAMDNAGVKKTALRKGETAFVPGNFTAAPGWSLFKIGENGFDFSRQAAALPPRREPLHLYLECSADEWTCRIGELPGFLWRRELALGPAEQHPATPEAIEKTFAAGAPAPWSAAGVSATLKGEPFFLPPALLKGLRREFWACALGALKEVDVKQAAAEAVRAFAASLVPGAPGPLPDLAGAFEIPAFIAEEDLPFWKRKIDSALRQGVRVFRIGGFHALKLLEGAPKCVIAGVFPLSVTNSRCAALFRELGFACAALSPELPERSAALLRERSDLPLFPDVPPPLLVSRAVISPEGVWHDRSGVELRLGFDPVEKLWKLRKLAVEKKQNKC